MEKRFLGCRKPVGIDAIHGTAKNRALPRSIRIPAMPSIYVGEWPEIRSREAQDKRKLVLRAP